MEEGEIRRPWKVVEVEVVGASFQALVAEEEEEEGVERRLDCWVVVAVEEVVEAFR